MGMMDMPRRACALPPLERDGGRADQCLKAERGPMARRWPASPWRR
jgi:hypothetical protein